MIRPELVPARIVRVVIRRSTVPPTREAVEQATAIRSRHFVIGGGGEAAIDEMRQFGAEVENNNDNGNHGQRDTDAS